MGLFNFFSRRRERESAIPGGSPESLTRQLKGDGAPIGRPVQGAGQPQALDLSTVAGLGSLFGMIQQASQAGSIQIHQGENQVVDMRGTTGLRDEILEAMRQHGIDPETGAAQGQVSAGDYEGMQQQIMQALQNHGVDVTQFGDAGGITIEGGGTIDSGASGDSGSDSGSSGGDSSSSGGDSGAGG
jgi:hypothetical protein